MKFLRYGAAGAEKPAILDDDGGMRDLSAHIGDVTGAIFDEDTLSRLRDIDVSSLPAVGEEVRIGPCIGGIGKFICIGLNYSDHAEEAGLEIPAEPLIFMKATSAVCGPNDNLEIPRGSTKTDWEVELGVIIGRRAKYVSVDKALDYVGGYCVINDVSERDFQMNHCGQWVKGKSADTFGPTGPWLVTRDEVPDPQNLSLWLKVNGEYRQKGSTARMAFTVAEVVAHISRFMTLHPGDVISTGTPPGVGMGMKPPQYLRPGDVVELGVEGLGSQRQEVVQG